MKPLPDQKTLRALLDYDPETGKLFWKERPLEMFDADWKMRKWNTRYAGREALACKHSNGYLYGNLFNQKVRSHRVIWKWMTGEDPQHVDHENGIRDDNRWENLRSVTKQENCKNQRLSRRNTSGVSGVSWSKGRGKWEVTIRGENRRDIHLGRFDCLNEAALVRKAAEIEHGYHVNHGR